MATLLKISMFVSAIFAVTGIIAIAQGQPVDVFFTVGCCVWTLAGLAMIDTRPHSKYR